MGKISKNARTDRGKNKDAKVMVKVIKAYRSRKTGAVAFNEKVVHKDKVKEFLAEE